MGQKLSKLSAFDRIAYELETALEQKGKEIEKLKRDLEYLKGKHEVNTLIRIRKEYLKRDV